jgi:hypothetical protein
VSLEVFHPPPIDIAKRTITIFDFQGPLFRSHHIHRNPVFFGFSCRHRFDSPDGAYGVLYVGVDAHCAFIESFGKPLGVRIVTTTALKNSAIAEIKPSRPLKLIDLTRSGALVRIGADARLFSGEHSVSRLWSQALHGHPAHADGLLYPSRLDPQRHSIALFGDRSPKLKELTRQSWYATGAQRHLLAEIMEHYGFDLIENRTVTSRKPAVSARQDELF